MRHPECADHDQLCEARVAIALALPKLGRRHRSHFEPLAGNNARSCFCRKDRSCHRSCRPPWYGKWQGGCVWRRRESSSFVVPGAQPKVARVRASWQWLCTVTRQRSPNAVDFSLFLVLQARALMLVGVDKLADAVQVSKTRPSLTQGDGHTCSSLQNPRPTHNSGPRAYPTNWVECR